VVAQANTLASLRGWSPFVGLQIEYNLVERTVERELIPMAKALNLGVIAWSPLSTGLLTGKSHGHGSSESGRMTSDMLKEFISEEHSPSTKPIPPNKTIIESELHTTAS
jgi:aryl-alcohol dehydrogenase-like predicted oxidoreductase